MELPGLQFSSLYPSTQVTLGGQMWLVPAVVDTMTFHTCHSNLWPWAKSPCLIWWIFHSQNFPPNIPAFKDPRSRHGRLSANEEFLVCTVCWTLTLSVIKVVTHLDEASLSSSLNLAIRLPSTDIECSAWIHGLSASSTLDRTHGLVRKPLLKHLVDNYIKSWAKPKTPWKSLTFFS